jgi:hypothetical protein
MTKHIQELRKQLNQTPSLRAFDTLCQMFIAWPKDEDKQMAFAYARQHLQNWPAYMCQPPSSLNDDDIKALHPLLPHTNQTPEETLTQALIAIQEQQWDKALDRVWLAWSQTHHPEIGLLLIELDDYLPPLILSQDPHQAQDQWLDCAAQQNPRWLGQLWKTLVVPRKHKLSLERLKALQGWCDDPRTTESILFLLATLPWTSNSSRVFWTALFRLLSTLQDPALNDTQEKILLRWHSLDLREDTHTTLTNQLQRAFSKRTPHDIVPLTPTTQQLLGTIFRALQTLSSHRDQQQLDGLWQQLKQQPRCTQTRQSIQQWWEAHQPKRHEFAALQTTKKLSKTQREQLKQLQQDNRRSWLGPLALLLKPNETYKQGFLHKAKLKRDCQEHLLRATNSPGWLTIEQLTCYAFDLPTLLESTPLPSLRKLTLSTQRGGEQFLLATQTLAQHPISKQIQRLVLDAADTHLRLDQLFSILQQLLSETTSLKSIACQARHNTNVTMTRDTDGQLSIWKHIETDTPQDLEMALWKLPLDHLTECHFDHHPDPIKPTLHALHFQTRLPEYHHNDTTHPLPTPQHTLPRDTFSSCHTFADVALQWYPSPHQHPLADLERAKQLINSTASVPYQTAALSDTRTWLAGRKQQQIYIKHHQSNEPISVLSSGQINLQFLQHPIAFLPDDSLLYYVADHREQYLARWSPDTKESSIEWHTYTPQHPPTTMLQIQGFALSPRRDTFACYHNKQQILMEYSLTQQHPIPLTKLQASPDNLLYSPEGRWLVGYSEAQHETNSTLFAWDRQTQRMLFRITHLQLSDWSVQFKDENHLTWLHAGILHTLPLLTPRADAIHTAQLYPQIQHGTMLLAPHQPWVAVAHRRGTSIFHTQTGQQLAAIF